MKQRESNGYFAKGNTLGCARKYENPEDLEKECVEYFNWADENPIYKNELIRGGDLAGTIAEVPLQRPYTLSGLCVYLGITQKTFRDYEKRERFLTLTTRVREIINTQKFEGASVGIFNASIIARDLGLSDKKEVEATIHTEQPLFTTPPKKEH